MDDKANLYAYISMVFFIISCPVVFFCSKYLSLGLGHTDIRGLATLGYSFVIIWFSLLLLGFKLRKRAYKDSGYNDWFVVLPLLNGALAGTLVFLVLYFLAAAFWE